MLELTSPRCAHRARLGAIGLMSAGAIGAIGCAASPHRPPTPGADAAQRGPQDAAQPASCGRSESDASAASGEALPAVRPMVLGTDVSLQSLLASADAAFAERTDEKQLKRAIVFWEQVHGLAPERADVALDLSRAYFLLGDSFYRTHADAAPNIMHDAFERGALAGEQALMLLSPKFAAKLGEGRTVEEALQACDAEAVDAMICYGQNLAAFAVARGIPTMLLYRKRLQTLVEQVIVRDEAAMFGAAYRIRGTFMAAAPSFAGGSLPQARAAFVRACLLAPNYLANALALAETWAVQAADRQIFVQILTQVAAADAQKLKDAAPEQILAQKRAAWLLTQVDRLF